MRGDGPSGSAVSAPGSAAESFIRAASEQAAHRLGWSPADPDDVRREAEAHGFVTSLVARSVAAFRLCDDRALGEAAFALASSPAMLAAFYQNIDLLYTHRFADADAVSALVMRALEHSAEMPRP